MPLVQALRLLVLVAWAAGDAVSDVPAPALLAQSLHTQAVAVDQALALPDPTGDSIGARLAATMFAAADTPEAARARAYSGLAVARALEDRDFRATLLGSVPEAQARELRGLFERADRVPAAAAAVQSLKTRFGGSFAKAGVGDVDAAFAGLGRAFDLSAGSGDPGAAAGVLAPEGPGKANPAPLRRASPRKPATGDRVLGGVAAPPSALLEAKAIGVASPRDFPGGSGGLLRSGKSLRALLTTKLAASDLPYGHALRPVRSLKPRLPRTLEEVPPARMSRVTDVGLASRVDGGSNGLVRLGYLEDGRPVALKAIYLPSHPVTGRSRDAEVPGMTLEEARAAQLYSDLGVSPEFHGLWKDDDGRWNVVFDIARGDHEGTPVNDQTFADLETILARMSAAGIVKAGDLQFHRSPEGRLLVIDPQSAAEGLVDSPQAQRQETAGAFALARLDQLREAPADVGRRYLERLEAVDRPAFEELSRRLLGMDKHAGWARQRYGDILEERPSGRAVSAADLKGVGKMTLDESARRLAAIEALRAKKGLPPLTIDEKDEILQTRLYRSLTLTKGEPGRRLGRGGVVVLDTPMADPRFKTFDHHARNFDPDRPEVNSTMLMLQEIEGYVSANGTSNRALNALSRRYERVHTDNLGDGMWAVWVARNLHRVARDPALRGLIMRATHYEDFGLFGNQALEDARSDPELARAIELQDAILNGYDGLVLRLGLDSDRFGDLGKETQAKVYGAALGHIDRVLADPAYRAENAQAFRRRVESAQSAARGAALRLSTEQRAALARELGSESAVDQAAARLLDDVQMVDYDQLAELGLFAGWAGQARSHDKKLLLSFKTLPPDAAGHARTQMILSVPHGRAYDDLSPVGEWLKTANARAAEKLKEPNSGTVFGRAALQVAFAPGLLLTRDEVMRELLRYGHAAETAARERAAERARAEKELSARLIPPEELAERFAAPEGKTLLGVQRGADGKLVPVYSASAGFTSRRDVPGPGLFGSKRPDWVDRRTARVVPLSFEPFPVTARERSPEWGLLPEALRAAVDAGRLPVTASRARTGGYSLLVMAAPDPAGEGKTGGRTGLLLDERGLPVVVEIGGKEFAVELKGAGTPEGGFDHEFAYRTASPRGALMAAPGRLELEMLERQRRDDPEFAAGERVRPGGLVEFSAGAGAQALEVRLTPATIRATYADNEAFPKKRSRENVREVAHGFGAQVGAVLARDVIWRTHYENLLSLGQGRYAPTDVGEADALSRLGPRHAKEALLRVLGSISELPGFETGAPDAFFAGLSEALAARGRLSEAQAAELAELSGALSHDAAVEFLWKNGLAYWMYEAKRADASASGALPPYDGSVDLAPLIEQARALIAEPAPPRYEPTREEIEDAKEGLYRGEPPPWALPQPWRIFHDGPASVGGLDERALSGTLSAWQRRSAQQRRSLDESGKSWSVVLRVQESIVGRLAEELQALRDARASAPEAARAELDANISLAADRLAAVLAMNPLTFAEALQRSAALPRGLTTLPYYGAGR